MGWDRRSGPAGACLAALGPEDAGHSPERADVLVWAVTQLLLNRIPEPRVRVL